MNADTLQHYLSGGRDLAEAKRDLAATADRLAEVPCPPRPLFAASDGELEFERAMRYGPEWRCSGCGWLYPGRWRAEFTDPCPECRHPFVQRIHRGAVEWPPTVEGRQRQWVLAVAERCIGYNASNAKLTDGGHKTL